MERWKWRSLSWGWGELELGSVQHSTWHLILLSSCHFWHEDQVRWLSFSVFAVAPCFRGDGSRRGSTITKAYEAYVQVRLVSYEYKREICGARRRVSRLPMGSRVHSHLFLPRVKIGFWGVGGRYDNGYSCLWFKDDRVPREWAESIPTTGRVKYHTHLLTHFPFTLVFVSYLSSKRSFRPSYHPRKEKGDKQGVMKTLRIHP